MALKPLGDRIIARTLEAKEQTSSGIVVPDNAKEKPQEAKVIAVGPGRGLEEGGIKPLEVKKGDRVLYGKYSGSEITIEGEEYLILREDEVLAVVNT